MPHCFAIVNQKGGVAKTTTAVNVATNLALRGNKVLLVDYDPQGNATMSVGLPNLTEEAVFGSAEFTIGQHEVNQGRAVFDFAPQRDVLGISTRHVEGRLDLVPATEELGFLESTLILMQDMSTSSQLLAKALRAVEQDYDFVIVDSGPTLGMLMINALAACQNVIVPVKLSPLSLPGATRLRRHIEDRLSKSLDPAINIFGVLGTFMVENAPRTREVFTALETIFGKRVFDTVIHHNQATDNASDSGVPIVLGKPTARGAIEYDKLTDEILARLGSKVGRLGIA